MFKKCLLLIFFVSLSSYSQVQTVFFVEDVDTIEVITVNFCVNDEAKISEVNIIPEKSTYRNEIEIKKLINYLKGIQYYPDSKLRNNCYDSTFDFVNKKYENAKLGVSDYSKCRNFRTGNYLYDDFRFSDTKIKRGKKIQKETSKNFNEKYIISWPNPCRYELEYATVNDKKNEHLIGKSIIVEIIAILENGYVYKSKLMSYPEKIGIIVKTD